MSLSIFVSKVKDFVVFKEHPKDTRGKDLDIFTDEAGLMKVFLALREFKLFRCFYVQKYPSLVDYRYLPMQTSELLPNSILQTGVKQRYVTYDKGEFKLIDVQVNGYYQRSRRVMIWKDIKKNSVKLKDGCRVLITDVVFKPWSFKQRILWVWNFVKRLFRNEGCIIVLLGPDGVGKTTVAKELVKRLSCAFNASYAYFGWKDFTPLMRAAYVIKPSGFSRSGKGKTNHKRIKALVYYAEMWMRFVPLWFKSRFLGRIYVLDRYFYDKGKRFIPRPDYLFILTAEPKTILKRKKELTLKRIKEIYQEYKTLPKATPINAEGSMKKTTTIITDSIAKELINKKIVLE